jgi:hypothetical protein
VRSESHSSKDLHLPHPNSSLSCFAW